MTSLGRLRTARRVVVAALGARALLWGAAVGLGLFAAAVLAVRAPGAAAGTATIASVGAGVAAGAWLLARGVRRASLPAVALWVEERVPQLGYALVTLAERPSSGTGALAPDTLRALDERASGIAWAPAVGRAARRALVPPVLAAAGAAAAAVAATQLARSPGWLREAAGASGVVRGGATAAGASASRLSPLTATVVPPAYTGRAAAVTREPSSVAGLVGSAVTLAGRGGASGIVASLGERPLALSGSGGRWAATIPMPARAAAVRFRDGVGERWVVLAPVPDSAPDVVLVAPARDTVFRTPAGSLQFVAELSDDMGLASGALEYIVSSGQGESFTFRSGTLDRRSFAGARTAELRATLSLGALRLGPGDVVHVRAVGRDRNSVSGPGVGYSETRTLRVARTGEYDSVAVEGAPPPEADKSLVSQRMLLMLTEALERKRVRLARADVLRESRRISTDQKRLRKTVGEIVFSRLGGDSGAEHSHDASAGGAEDEHGGEAAGGAQSAEDVLREADEATGRGVDEALDFHGDETPVVAINRPLLEAYNAMWDASRELDVGAPGRAIPPMRVALAAIQRARAAERIYLRGRPPAVVVDVGKARLKGEGSAAAAPRRPRPAAESPVRDRADRLARALAALTAPRASSAGRAAALDSLLLLRVDALDGAPALATALGDLIDALRAGRDATGAVARARELAGGEAETRPTLPAWSGAW